MHRLQLDLAWNRVLLDGSPIELTATECRVLAYLAQHHPRCVPGAELLSEVWGRDSGKARVVKTTVHRLRQKLESDPKAPEILVTVAGRGYRLTLSTGPAPLAPLPGTSGAWINRPMLWERVEAALTEERGAFLVGPGGVGKTRLAAEMLRALAPTYEGGAARVDVAGSSSVARLCGAVADQLQIGIEGDAAGQIGRALASRGPCLLLIDNLDAAPVEVLECIDAWAASAVNLRWLLTSRRWTAVRGTVRIGVEPMTNDQAAELFAARVREAGEPPSDVDAVRALVAEVDGIPLAVELAASCSDILTAGELADRLRGANQALNQVIATSWSLLTRQSQQVLAQSAVFVDGFTAAAAEAVLNVEHGSPLAELRTLRHHSLLERIDGRFRLLPVVREAVSALEPDARDDATGRLIEWVARAATVASLGVSTRELPAYLQWFRDERATLLEAFDRASTRSVEHAAQIALALCRAEDALGSQGHAEVLSDALELEVPASKHAWFVRFRAKLHAANGRADQAQAWFERALEGADDELTRQLGYDRGELWLVLGDYARAGAVMEPMQDTEPLGLRAHVLRRLGEMARHRGDNETASVRFERALEAARMSGSIPVLLSTLASSAEFQHAAGHGDLAFAQLARAISMAEAHDLKAALARALMIHGHASNDDGHPVEALRTLRQACDLQRRGGNLRGLMHILLRLGWIEAGIGESASARRHLREGRALARVSATPLLPYFEMNLAVCELDEGRAAAAIERLHPAVALAEEGSSDLNLASLLFHRAWALGAAGHTQLALADVDRSIPLCETVAPAFAGENCALRACLDPDDRDSLHKAQKLMTGERNALGAIRLLQVRRNRPDAPLTAPVRAEAEKSAFGRQVLRWLES